MGFIYTYKPPGLSVKQFFGREFDHGPEANGQSLQVIGCRVIDNVAYLACERVTAATGERFTFALVCLLDRNSGLGFGYKQTDEGAEPFDCACPAAILDRLSPSNDPGALRWRAACRDRLAGIAC